MLKNLLLPITLATCTLCVQISIVQGTDEATQTKALRDTDPTYLRLVKALTNAMAEPRKLNDVDKKEFDELAAGTKKRIKDAAADQIRKDKAAERLRLLNQKSSSTADTLVHAPAGAGAPVASACATDPSEAPEATAAHGEASSTEATTEPYKGYTFKAPTMRGRGAKVLAPSNVATTPHQYTNADFNLQKQTQERIVHKNALTPEMTFLFEYTRTNTPSWSDLRKYQETLERTKGIALKKLYFPTISYGESFITTWNELFENEFKESYFKGIITSALLHKNIYPFKQGFIVEIDPPYRLTGVNAGRKAYIWIRCLYNKLYLVDSDTLPGFISINEGLTEFVCLKRNTVVADYFRVPEALIAPFKYALDTTKQIHFSSNMRGIGSTPHLLERDSLGSPRYQRAPFLNDGYGDEANNDDLLEAIRQRLNKKAVSSALHIWYLSEGTSLKETFLIPLYADPTNTGTPPQAFCTAEIIQDKGSDNIYYNITTILTPQMVESMIPCTTPEERMKFFTIMYQDAS